MQDIGEAQDIFDFVESIVIYELVSTKGRRQYKSCGCEAELYTCDAQIFFTLCLMAVFVENGSERIPS